MWQAERGMNGQLNERDSDAMCGGNDKSCDCNDKSCDCTCREWTDATCRCNV